MEHEPACVGFKTCTHCKERKHVLQFSRHKRNSDGLQSWCRECRRKDVLARERRNAKPLKETWQGTYGAARFFETTPNRMPSDHPRQPTGLADHPPPKKKRKPDPAQKHEHYSSAARSAWAKMTPEERAARAAKAQETMRRKKTTGPIPAE